MAEYVNTNIVTVPAGQNVPLTETAVAGKSCIVHREGSGQVFLRGLTNQCKARFRVSFGGNISVPTGGTVGAITAALAINGEPLTSAVAQPVMLPVPTWAAMATVTPAAVENYFNIFVAANVDVPKGCCVTVAMENTSAQAISFANSNMIVERVC